MTGAMRRTMQQVRDASAAAARTRELEGQIERLQAQNERLRAAMRRCTSCEYRLDVLARNGTAVDEPSSPG